MDTLSPTAAPSTPARSPSAPRVAARRRSLAALLRAARILFGRRWRTFLRADELSLLILGAIIGLVSGLGVLAINMFVQALHEAIFLLPKGERLSAQTVIDPLRAGLAPIIGGLCVGLLTVGVRRWRKREAVDPIEANALYGGRMSMIDSLLLTLGTMISSGSGASVGLEAGYTQSASGLASRIGRTLRLRRADMRTLVGCGAAAAISAAFDAPLAGAFYAFELVLGAYSVVTLAPVVLAAVVANLVYEALQPTPPLPISASLAFTPYDFGVFVIMAMIAGGLGIAMMKLATAIEGWLLKSGLPRFLRPAAGGVVVGGLALAISPAVLGAGHGGAHAFIVETHGWQLLALLLMGKLLAAAVSVGSGFRGGLFFTSLFVGVLFGNLSAELYASALPALASDRLVYVLVGMATLAAAVIGAPLTMVFLVLGATRDITLTSGVLVAVVVTTIMVRRTFGYSFSTWRLHLRGETIRSALDVGWARDLTVVKLMRREARIANATMTIAQFRKRFPVGSTERVFLQDEEGRYDGFVLVPEVHAPENDAGAETTSVRELRLAPASFLTPRQTIEKVLDTFEKAEVETLPVVDDAASLKVLGYVTEAYALKRYSQELERRRREETGER